MDSGRGGFFLLLVKEKQKEVGKGLEPFYANIRFVFVLNFNLISNWNLYNIQ